VNGELRSGLKGFDLLSVKTLPIRC
jgi:hypothetical protein